MIHKQKAPEDSENELPGFFCPKYLAAECVQTVTNSNKDNRKVTKNHKNGRF